MRNLILVGSKQERRLLALLQLCLYLKWFAVNISRLVNKRFLGNVSPSLCRVLAISCSWSKMRHNRMHFPTSCPHLEDSWRIKFLYFMCFILPCANRLKRTEVMHQAQKYRLDGPFYQRDWISSHFKVSLSWRYFEQLPYRPKSKSSAWLLADLRQKPEVSTRARYRSALLH